MEVLWLFRGLHKAGGLELANILSTTSDILSNSSDRFFSNTYWQDFAVDSASSVKQNALVSLIYKD